ncbi:hypothetical protein IKG33_02925 [Candidatus Saccharibacteria bacterium]|nr:hypothetical protein [Candidatus Saccharibacteria bacterium]
MIDRALNRVIIIKGNGRSIFDGIDDVYDYCRIDSMFIRVFRKIMKKLKISFLEPIFYGEWKKELEKCDAVILFDNDYEYVDKIVHYMKKKNQNLKIIFWYWNPLSFFHGKIVKNKNIDEVWTYNVFDARKYGLKYNTQFYRLLIPAENCCEIKNDMIFLGLDKGREAILQRIKKAATSQGLSCDFHVVKSKKDIVSYLDYIKSVIHANCVVDLVSSQDCGLTRRPLEALFYGKKLVTNYEDIVNYDFYNKNNVFLIGHDDINELAEFMKKPYKSMDKNMIQFYSYDSWLERMKKGRSLEL